MKPTHSKPAPRDGCKLQSVWYQDGQTISGLSALCGTIIHVGLRRVGVHLNMCTHSYIYLYVCIAGQTRQKLQLESELVHTRPCRRQVQKLHSCERCSAEPGVRRPPPSRGAEVDADCSGTETLWTFFVVYMLSLRCIRVTGETHALYTGLSTVRVCMSL